MMLLPAGFLMGFLGAWFMSCHAARFGMLDLPNNRSSHTLPTPRSGGIGILAAFSLASIVLQFPSGFWLPPVILGLLSFYDDRIGLSARLRLCVQFVAALSVFFCLLPVWDLSFWGWVLAFLSTFYVVTTCNLYNFMDGINGIAALTGTIGFCFVAMFGCLSGTPNELIMLSLALSLACLGFLPFNFPKARVFMGDVGSVLLGFVFAVLVVNISNEIKDFLCLASFMALFYADSLTTLCVRFIDGENLFKAHRRHIYQIAANEMNVPHWLVTITYGAIQISFAFLMIGAWERNIYWQLLLLGVFVFTFIAITSRIRINLKKQAVP